LLTVPLTLALSPKEPVAEVIFTAENAEVAEKNIIIMCSLCDLSVLCGEIKQHDIISKTTFQGGEGRVPYFGVGHLKRHQGETLTIWHFAKPRRDPGFLSTPSSAKGGGIKIGKTKFRKEKPGSGVNMKYIT
jgi:hypothetical protein